MLLGEPPGTQFDLHFEVLGTPVRVHPFFWLAGLILGSRGDGMSLLIWLLVFFVSILVHEMGHALMMRRFGISSHVVLYMMGGLAISDSMGFGSRSRSSTMESILISFAGPAAGFAFAALTAAVVIGTGGGFEFIDGFPFIIPVLNTPIDMNPRPLNLLVFDLLMINIFWGLINLMPVFPLDGGQIARAILMAVNPWNGATQAQWLSVFTGGAMVLVALMLQSLFMAILFGMLAFQSYMSLNSFGGGGFGGGMGGGRPW